MPIYLTRHGDDTNPAPGYLTDKDVRLSALGEQQAAACAQKLQQVIDTTAPVHIITSPKRRTLQAAQILEKTLALPSGSITKDPRLEERDVSSYFGQTIAQVFSQPEEALTAGGMEAYGSLFARLASCYTEITKTYPDASIIIVTHGGNLRPLQQIANQLPADPYGETKELAPDDFIQLQ